MAQKNLDKIKLAHEDMMMGMMEQQMKVQSWQEREKEDKKDERNKDNPAYYKRIYHLAEKPQMHHAELLNKSSPLNERSDNKAFPHPHTPLGTPITTNTRFKGIMQK